MVFITATFSIFFKNQNENQEVWTLDRAEDILLRWTVLVYGLLFALWFFLNMRLRKRLPKGSLLRGFSLGATAGSMAGNMWCTRVAAVFAADCASAHVCSPWGHWLPWVLLSGAVFFAVVNVPYMTRGMQKYEALYMVTIFQGSNIVSNSLSALIILREMDGAPWWKLIGYTGCIVVMVACLWVLVSGEEAVCPSNELDADLQRMVSMEEGVEPEDTESEEEPHLMDFVNFVRAISLDQYSPLSLSNPENVEYSRDEEGSRNEEEEQHEKPNDMPTAELTKPSNCRTWAHFREGTKFLCLLEDFLHLTLNVKCCRVRTQDLKHDTVSRAISQTNPNMFGHCILC